MKQKIIVDTSVWIEYFKNNPEVVKIIEDGLNNGIIYIAGPIISELLQGVKTKKEFDKLSQCIDTVPYLECNIDNWIKSGEISFQLRQKGITIPLTDIIISAVSINNDTKIFTMDKHFKLIPGVDLFSL